MEFKGRLPSGKTSPSPKIKFFPAASEVETGMGIIIFPGGGYAHLAEHEGKDYAEFLAANGINSFVVEYRLGSEGFHHPCMLEDALAAIREVRVRSEEFGVAPSRVGVMGSSAGGHLAAHAMVAFDDYKSDVPLRPDFGILCYPVIQSDTSFAHIGSMENLLGDSVANPEILASMSLDKRVSPNTPPAFIWHTLEDVGVPMENSMAFASALRSEDIPFELHLYEKGAHGLGLKAAFDWGSELLRWLKRFAPTE